MKRALFLAVLLSLFTALPALANDRPRLVGDYVEARTAEVFAGGCIMNSEAETAGRQAVLAWRVTSGDYNGVALDGLTVVAAVAGNRNLGMRELGGEAPDAVRAVVTIDETATPSQRDALVALTRELTRGLITDVVRIDTAPLRYIATPGEVIVSGARDVALHVTKEMTHDPTCGAMQWFTPFVPLSSSAMGVAESHAFSGSGLGTKWSAPNKRSAFWGEFEVKRRK